MNGNIDREPISSSWTRDPNGGYHITNMMLNPTVDDSTWIRDPNGGYHISSLQNLKSYLPYYTFDVGSTKSVDYGTNADVEITKTETSSTTTNISFSFSIPKGESAYDVAVDNGFSGTEVEWLASLKGVDGTNGTNGTDGKSVTISQYTYSTLPASPTDWEMVIITDKAINGGSTGIMAMYNPSTKTWTGLSGEAIS